MVTVTLPDLPKGKEFEEYISAFLQVGGYYIERNIIERDIEEVLELDIVATNYEVSPPEITLIEVKSGDWGFPDLFKVRGWMDYLNMTRGTFITNVKKDNIKFIKKKAHSLNIDLILIPELSKSKKELAKLLNNEDIKAADIEIWRFSYWIERNLLKRLSHKKKCRLDKKRFTALADYHFHLNSGIFLLKLFVVR